MVDYIVIFIVFIVTLIIYKINKPKIKGAIGEQKVASILKKLDPKKYIVLNDVLIQVGNRTSQIDHVVISNYGIFVIETKNYKGWIYGNDTSNYWTQAFYKKKVQFLNPILQNYSHVSALERILGNIGKLSIIPIVVFSPQAKLKVQVNSHVIDMKDLLKTIRQYREPIYSDFMKQKIYYKIQKENKNDYQTKKIHIQNVQQRKKEVQKLIENNKCPKCGNELVVKNGKYGEFKACAGYPKCKFTLKI